MDYVISMNLRRRHLSESQRAQAMANLCGLARGGDRGNQYTGGKGSRDPLALTSTQAADKAGVSEKTMKRAVTVHKHGSEDLKQSVLDGKVAAVVCNLLIFIRIQIWTLNFIQHFSAVST